MFPGQGHVQRRLVNTYHKGKKKIKISSKESLLFTERRKTTEMPGDVTQGVGESVATSGTLHGAAAFSLVYVGHSIK